MMRSLSSAVAGLRSHQTKMDVIGNNIANVNTYGFKSSRTTFSDVYYQTLSIGSTATSNTGGTNPTQIGYGASVATIDVLNTITGNASTDRPFDVYISGDGFVVSKDTSGKFQYTRLGIMGFDADNNLVDGNGQLIQGFPLNPDGTPKISADGTVSADQLQTIHIDPALAEKITSLSISSSGAIIGQLPGDTVITVDSGIPPWLNGLKVNLPGNSNYTGSVSLAISGLCSKEYMTSGLGLAAGDVTSVEMGTVPLPAGSNYTISVDYNGLVTLSRPATGTDEAITLTGSVKNGKLVLADTGGNVGITVNFDPAKDISIKPTTKTVQLYKAVETPTPGTKRLSDTGNEKPVTVAGPENQANGIYIYRNASGQPIDIDENPVAPGAEVFVKTTNVNTGYPVRDTTGNAIPNRYIAITEGGVAPSTTVPELVPYYDADGVQDGFAEYTTFNTGIPIYGAGSDKKTQLQDANGNPLFVRMTDGAVPTPNDMALSYDKYQTQQKAGDGGPLYVTVIGKTPDNGEGVPFYNGGVLTTYYVKSVDAGTAEEITTKSFPAITLYRQMTTKDKGGNTVKVPAEAEPFAEPGGYPFPMVFGELTIELTSRPDKPFNGVLGKADAANGEKIVVGNLALAKFPNSAGLQQSGSSYFDETLNSGSPIYIMPGLEGTGDLAAGYLEMSNVDLSKEFTDMITTQRGFQANTRIITVSDEMLQELVNLKR